MSRPKNICPFWSIAVHLTFQKFSLRKEVKLHFLECRVVEKYTMCVYVCGTNYCTIFSPFYSLREIKWEFW
jgi:hypothetical protein